jgi:hypothetical protein
MPRGVIALNHVLDNRERQKSGARITLPRSGTVSQETSPGELGIESGVARPVAVRTNRAVRQPAAPRFAPRNRART